MSERLARRAANSNLESAARRFEQQAAVARRRAELVKNALAGATTAIEAASALGKRYQADEN